MSAPPATAARGQTFDVTDTAANPGRIDASASTTRYYLSADGRQGGAKRLTGARAVLALAPAGTSTGTVTVRIPTNTAPGAYFLLACADDTAKVVEVDETNNCIASATRISVTP